MSFAKIEPFLDTEYPRFPGNDTNYSSGDPDLQGAYEQIAEHEEYQTSIINELFKDYVDRRADCANINNLRKEMPIDPTPSIKNIGKDNQGSLTLREEGLKRIVQEMATDSVKERKVSSSWYKWFISRRDEVKEAETILSGKKKAVEEFLNVLREICKQRRENANSIEGLIKTVSNPDAEEHLHQNQLAAIEKSHEGLLEPILSCLKQGIRNMYWLRADLIKKMDFHGIPTKDDASTLHKPSTGDLTPEEPEKYYFRSGPVQHNLTAGELEGTVSLQPNTYSRR